MDSSGSVFTSLTLASIITTGGLAIHLQRNFGKLAEKGTIAAQTDGDKLVGEYANAVTGMSSVTVALGTLFIVFYLWAWYRRRGKKNLKLNKVFWVMLLITVLLGVSSAGVNIGLTENFKKLRVEGDITPAEADAVGHYPLKGVYGVTTVSMAGVSVGSASLTLLWLAYAWLERTKKDPLGIESVMN